MLAAAKFRNESAVVDGAAGYLRETLTSFSPRDLRRTFETIAGSFGLSLEIRNRLQGHGMSDVGSVHYDRYDYLTEKRTAMLVWTRSLRRLLSLTALLVLPGPTYRFYRRWVVSHAARSRGYQADPKAAERKARKT
ncbi:hypothetical protein [Tabrizicola sp.]|uniref:hypothetical protein n=1 Tax=Tabrizicola sp. TaxID=2005166 RepID=UPI00286CEB46|nr:hypothetical protein [Tabrizicola sp.]